jgi:hypothetical protein
VYLGGVVLSPGAEPTVDQQPAVVVLLPAPDLPDLRVALLQGLCRLAHRLDGRRRLHPGADPTKHNVPNFTHICKIFLHIFLQIRAKFL